MKLFYLSIVFFANVAFGGGIKGTVKNEKGEPLPYTSIQLKGTTVGTMTNEEGKYEFSLLPGEYQILFSYIGFQTLTKTVKIEAATFSNLDIVMKEQIIDLGEVKVLSANEDPANTIMRKAISMAKIHLLEVAGYSGRCYIRGGGRLTKIPGLAKMAFADELKKSGIDENTTFFNESLSDISYTYPSTFRQKVISLRSNIPGGEASSPNQYINTRFYNPLIIGAVSPLSPRAFSYYKFEYLGTFTDRGYEVSKIKVTPRSKGDDVFSGVIYITENQWSIHSLSLTTMHESTSFDIQQVYTPVQDIWMPATMKFKVSGGLFGFKGEFNYNASVTNYKVSINQQFHNKVEVIDEKIDKTQTLVDKVKKPNSNKMDIGKTLSQSKELNGKQLSKVLKEFEKQDKKERKIANNNTTVNISRNDSIVIDTLARKRSTAFWDTVRTVPLTELEIKSTIKFDSIKIVQDKEAKKDSLKKKKAGEFNLGTLLIGGVIGLGAKDSLKNANGTYTKFNRTRLLYDSPITSLNFNTVEGYYANLGLGITKDLNVDRKINIKSLLTGRYGFSSKMPFLKWENRLKYYGHQFQINGGTWIQQFNKDVIDPTINSFTTLMFERNYLKMYQKQFIELVYKNTVSDHLILGGSLEYQHRGMLNNNSEFKYFDWANRIYTSNTPLNEEMANTAIIGDNATLLNIAAEYRPILRYRIYNGRKRVDASNSPIIRASFNAGLPNILNSGVDFQRIELGYEDKIEVGVRGQLSFAFKAGTFLNATKLDFPDYKHFAGNLIVLQYGDPLTTFRMLDYTRFSTKTNFVEGHALYNFRKFLLTRIPILRVSSIREHVFVNYVGVNGLKTNYIEAGYGIQGILKILRIEGVVNFLDGKYQSVGMRIGLSTKLRVQKSDD